MVVKDIKGTMITIKYDKFRSLKPHIYFQLHFLYHLLLRFYLEMMKISNLKHKIGF